MSPLRLCAAVTSLSALLLAAGSSFGGHEAGPAPVAEPQDVLRQFDFWVGEWDVYSTQTGDLSGTNDITLVSGGEMLLEEWRNTSGGRGTSLSWFEATDRKWHQMWITLGEGATESIGEWKDGVMLLVSKEGDVVTGRCAWTPREDGTVRQHWETTKDGGTTWKTEADLIYERRAEAAEDE